VKTFSNSVKYWYLPLILGIVLIACGAYALVSPLSTYIALSLFFSISFIVSGVSEIAFSLANTDTLKSWGWYLVSGLLSLILGIYLVSAPGVSMSILPVVVAFALLFRAFLQLGFSFDLKDHGVKGWGYAAFLSVVGIIFCFVLLINPVFAGMSIVAFTAFSFLATGIASIVLSFRLKKLNHAR